MVKLTKQAMLNITQANSTFSEANKKYYIKDKDFLRKIKQGGR